ncbi:MAG TPA: indole-3-glycerol-phosphate synthase [Acidimicrobiia bacterium]|nr:indole-3-glycerol-phosphate synthase [Acidimicrobiia bacterium]
MSDFLRAMADKSRMRADEAARLRPSGMIQELALAAPGPRPLGAFGAGFDLIAEIKPSSPSEGRFPERDPIVTAAGYRKGGAGMLSVLTEPSSFGGSLEVLRRVSVSTDLPVMAKDFLVDSYQVYEAREAGADGVLVIARILSDEMLQAMIEVVRELGIFALLEAFDEDDLIRLHQAAEGYTEVLIGVNCRDLDTLEIVPGRHQELAGLLPEGTVNVAESAMRSEEDIERVAALGYTAALVGSALMRSENATDLVRSMVAAGRRVAVTA